MVTQFTGPLAMISAAPLASLIEPWLAEDGLLSTGIVAKIVGVGKGRGLCLLFLILASLLIAVSGVTFYYPRLRNLEDEIPDAIVVKQEVEDSTDTEIKKKK
eukprot:TRINITY_DN12909_c0_g1_i1.p1 TRINITY_DN12909_c0_g1~~TRINITY_DN12909_c0_g1_i1.p1  ORF type:complete len:114 (-),score=25.13 TRINITY_DN12909_c0_g1_i1:30-335(-)